jgi:hypothetical protein
VAVEAELKRRDPNGALIAWNLNADGTSPTADAEARSSLTSIVNKLGDILIELQQKLESGGTVALDAATLAALETITASVANFPASYPLPTSQVTDLKTVTVSNPTADPETGLAKEVTLVQVRDYLDTVETKLQSLIDQTDSLEPVLADVKRSVTDYESRLDYAGRADGNPVYIGKNAQAALTSAATWTIQKLDYDTNNRLTRAQVKTGAWDNRAVLF